MSAIDGGKSTEGIGWRGGAARACVAAASAVLGAAALGAVLAGCGEQQAPEARGALNVALIVPTTGELSSYGHQCRKGAELALAEVADRRESAGEVRLWLNIRDDSARADVAETTARQLYDVAHFLAVVGPVAADSAVAVAKVLEPDAVSLVVPTVETHGLATGHKNIVQLCLTSSAQGRRLATFVAENLAPRTKRALVVEPAGDTEAEALAKALKDALGAKGAGFEIDAATLTSETGRDEIDRDAIDRVVARVKATQPGVVVAAVGAEAMGLLVQRLREAGESVPIVAGSHAYARSALAPIGRGLGEVYVAAHFAPDEDRPAVQAFVAAYRRENRDATPGAAAALTYDAVKLVDQALREAMPGTKDEKGRWRFPTPQAVGDRLRTERTIADAVTGPITVHPDGRVEKPLIILRLDEVGSHFHARAAL